MLEWSLRSGKLVLIVAAAYLTLVVIAFVTASATALAEPAGRTLLHQLQESDWFLWFVLAMLGLAVEMWLCNWLLKRIHNVEKAPAEDSLGCRR